MISGVAGNSPEVRVYKGIPFAAPPVGDLRFRAPQPPAKWEGTRKADQFGPMCMQGGGRGPRREVRRRVPRKATRPRPAMSEDCLYLNVWTAAASPE